MPLSESVLKALGLIVVAAPAFMVLVVGIPSLLDRKLIAEAGRKNVVGKPILYKTTRDFLVQFGLKDLAELPTLKEFEELGRLSVSEAESGPQTELPLEVADAPDAPSAENA